MTDEVATYGDADERTRDLEEQLREIDGAITEEIAWQAIRAAYARGYDDALKVRAEGEES